MRVGLYGLIACAALTFAAPLLAADKQDGADCLQTSNPDRRIAGCTHIIDDRGLSARLHAVAHNGRGIAYRGKGDLDHAIADFGQAIRLEPKFAEAYNNRGAAYNAKGDLDHALADLDQAIRLNPEDAAAYYNRGISWEVKGDLQKALANYKRFSELDPTDPDGPKAIERVTKALAGK